MENKNNSGSIGSGFLLGLLLGVLLTLLLATKKGREIFKDLIDKAIQKISDLEQSVEDYAQSSKPEEIKKEIISLAEEILPHTKAEADKPKDPVHIHEEKNEPAPKPKEQKQEPKQESKPATEKKHFFRKNH
jgi:gas vesicle protein